MEQTIYNLKQYILQEGYSKIGIAFGSAIVLYLLGYTFLAKVAFLVTVALLWIYRNNFSVSKNPINLANTLYAPIDGKIMSIDTQDGVQKIYIDVDLCGSHILRAPINGNYFINLYQKGLNLSSWSFKSRALNNKAIVSFSEFDGSNTKMEIISGMCGSDVVLYNNIYEVNTRDRIGVFVQGTIVLEVASNYSVKVSIGDKVAGGISVIAGKIE
jgi:hypothetical protein